MSDMEAAVREAGLLVPEGEIAGALRAFDSVLRLRPDLESTLWQRGLALYYASRYEEGSTQFEVNMKSNGADVEEVVWRCVCDAKVLGFEAARERMLVPAGVDDRVPMKEILALFRGDEGSSVAIVQGLLCRRYNDCVWQFSLLIRFCFVL